MSLSALLLIYDLLGRQRVLLVRLRMLQLSRVEVLDTRVQLQLALFLLNHWKKKSNTNLNCELSCQRASGYYFKFYVKQSRISSIECVLPVVSGNTIFSAVVACFMVDLSKRSTPLRRFWWTFSCATTGRFKPKAEYVRN